MAQTPSVRNSTQVGENVRENSGIVDDIMAGAFDIRQSETIL
jgi:hypothetical protein